MLHDRYFFAIIYMGDRMGNFEDLCVKILDGVEARLISGDLKGLENFIAEMREQVELCRNVSKNER